MRLICWFIACLVSVTKNKDGFVALLIGQKDNPHSLPNLQVKQCVSFLVSCRVASRNNWFSDAVTGRPTIEKPRRMWALLDPIRCFEPPRTSFQFVPRDVLVRSPLRRIVCGRRPRRFGWLGNGTGREASVGCISPISTIYNNTIYKFFEQFGNP